MLPQTHSLSPPSILTAAATINFSSPNPTLYSIKPFTITQLNSFNKTPHLTSSFKPFNFTASIASLSTLTPHIFCSSSSNLQFSLHTGSSLHVQRRNLFRYRKLHFRRNTSSSGEIRAVRGHKEITLSPWDEKPYELSSGGKKVYFDEQDIVSFLDPPKELIPLDRSSYNPAAYLWKKIDDIPEERRHRLLHLLNQRLTSRVWEIAGMRYEDSKLAKKSASNFLTNTENIMSLEFWNCRTSGGPIPISWMNFFKKVIFRRDGQTYGRILVGGPVLGGIANSFSTLYFTVREHKEVMSTEQPCDLAYEFGDGLLDLHDYPQGFPKPVKHPWPFNDHVVVYVRHVGPGVLVGQAWQEGKQLEQVPKKLCGEILMVKDY